MLHRHPIPAAIGHGRVRAASDPSRILGEIQTAVTEMRTNLNGRYDGLQAEMDALTGQMATARLGAGGAAPLAAPDPEYTRLFSMFFRYGHNDDELRKANATGDRGRIQAAMSVGSAGDGGLLAPVEWDRRILEAQRTTSPMRQVATVHPTSVGGYSSLWNNNQFGSGWVGETANRPTTTTPTLSPLYFPSGEIYAQPAVTQTLLDDAQVDIAQWLVNHVSTEFDRQEGIAFVSGDGVNKPAGFLQYVPGGTYDATANPTKGHPGGNLDVVPSGNASSVTGDGLIAMLYGLAAPYRQNASWYMSSATAAQVMTLKNGQGNYLWQNSFVLGQPPSLLGRPVVIDENMPLVAAGNMPIAFGDFAAGYIINDRMGTRIIRDPYTNKPYVLLYVTRRVGAGVQDPRAIRVMKIAAS